jgi:hypothetical protein
MNLSFGMFILKVIGNSLSKFSLTADKLAVSDIDVNVEIRSNDKIGKLERSLKSRTENIKVQAGNAEKIAQRDLSAEVKLNIERDVLSKSMIKIIAGIHSVFNET